MNLRDVDYLGTHLSLDAWTILTTHSRMSVRDDSNHNQTSSHQHKTSFVNLGLISHP